MPGEGNRAWLLRALLCLQVGWIWVTTVVWRRHRFGFGAPADSREQVVEDRPHRITSSDGETARHSDATSSGNKKWKEIVPALASKPSDLRELQLSNNIDPAGEYKVLLDTALQPTDAAAKRASAQCQTPVTPPPRRSLEDSNEKGSIITAQRTPELAFQDVKIGKEVVVINPCYMKNIGDHIESLNQGDTQETHVASPALIPDNILTGVKAVYDERFRQFENPELDNAAAGELAVDAKPFTGPKHVPLSVSEGNVSTFAIHVDKTKTTLVPSLEKHRPAAGEWTEVLASLEQTPPTEKKLLEGNDGSGSLGQGSSSSSSI